MENSEVSRSSERKFNPQADQPGRGGNQKSLGKKEQTTFDSDNREAEINPSKLNREEIDLDRTGVDTSKGHEPYEFKAPEGASGSGFRSGLERHPSGGAGGAQSGQGANVPRRELNSGESKRENLMGQGGYGSSGMSSTNSENSREEKNLQGERSGGSQDGSTGYKGTQDNDLRSQPSPKVDINKLGFGNEPREDRV